MVKASPMKKPSAAPTKPTKRAAPTKRKAGVAFSHGIKLKQGKAPAAANGSAKAVAKLAGRAGKAAKEAAKAASGESPYKGFPRPTAKDVAQLHTALARVFGERRPAKERARRSSFALGGPKDLPPRKREILDTVVGTILSQNTTNTNSHRAFVQLTQRFGSWEEVRTAKVADIVAAIRCAGLAPKKSEWIKDILQTVHKEQGVTSMEYLRTASKEEVHVQLERFTGIGKKTAAIINLFDCDNPDMAVDTHVFRYALQLGWAPTDTERAAHNKKAAHSERWPTVTRDTVYAHVDAIFPDSLKYSMHLILTDTEGGLPVVCPTGKTLGFDGRSVKVDGAALRKP